MSLLMEALKKAEQAKKAGEGESQPSAQATEMAETSPLALEILTEEPAAPEAPSPSDFPSLELENLPERPAPASQQADLVQKPEASPAAPEAVAAESVIPPEPPVPAPQESSLSLAAQQTPVAPQPLPEPSAPPPKESAPPPRVAPAMAEPLAEPKAPPPAQPAPPVQPAPARPAPAATAPRKESSQDERKKTASKVFLAKQPAMPSSKRRILALAGLAVGIALGGGAYLYWQLNRPVASGFAASPVEGTPPGAPQPATPPAATPPAETAAAPVQEAATPVTLANAPAEPPPATSQSTAPQSATAQPAPPAPKPVEPLSMPRAASAQSNLPTPGIKIERLPSVSRVNPNLASAYQALMSGNDRAAQADYAKVLKQDANNRDALLGMAAIASRAGRVEEAGLLYQRLLELNPKDPAALAGLVAISGQADPVSSESRVKNLLAQQPDSPNLHFSLGNLYLSQSRWPEAQQAFFMAVKGEPSNPDYAYNLAVSLDHMSQRKAALDYYRRALTLSSSRSASFDRQQVQARIEELTAAVQ